MHETCVRIRDDDTCQLDDETCETGCPFFECRIEQNEWHKKQGYAFWDHQIAIAREQQEGQ